MTGSKDRRPALDRLTVAAKRREFDCVLVWKLDRFARSLKHLVNALAEFEAPGHCIRQPAGQPGPEHAFRPTDVPNHRRDG